MLTGSLQGRTIKNILRTAVAYANAEDGVLNARHVLAIVQTELKDEELSESAAQGLKEMKEICESQKAVGFRKAKDGQGSRPL